MAASPASTFLNRLPRVQAVPTFESMLHVMMLSAFFGSSLEVGDTAPDFSVVDTDGRTHTLSQMLKHGPVVLAFFPKAFTPGCSREVRSYSERFAEIEKLGAQVLAVSTDSPETLRRFKQEIGAAFPLIPDPDGTLTELYQVKTLLLQMAKRRTFVIAPDRRITSIQSGSDAIDPGEAIQACEVR